MKTGEIVRDADGRAYQVGPLLGRGTWGKSYLCRLSDGEGEAVLKRPLSRDDFRGELPAGEALIDACAAASAEQLRLLAAAPEEAALPMLKGRNDGPPAMFFTPRYTTSLDRRINQGTTLSEVLSVTLQVLEQLMELSKHHGAHGNLHPANVLLNDRGEVALSDASTPASRRVLRMMAEHGQAPHPYLPAEAIGVPDGGKPSVNCDTFSLCMSVYRAALTPRGGDTDGRLGIDLPREGLDKAALVALKDSAIERLRQEDSNPRFHQRFADRLAAVVNRGISKETSPSPPFRFNSYADLKQRLEEVRALVRPRIESVGKVMLDRPPADPNFETGESVSFAVLLATSPGVDTHEEVACGIALFDAESGERMREVECAYTVDRRQASRYRFSFRIGELPPGRYRGRVAFAVRDSGQQPETSEAVFEVRAAAGYIPPSQPHGAAALPFQRPTVDPEAHEETRPNIALNMDQVDTASGVRSAGPPQPISPATTPTLPPPIVPGPPPPRPIASLPNAHISVDRPSEVERTEPAVQLNTQLPKADPLGDIVGAGSWTELPLPGRGQDDLDAPLLDDAPAPDSTNPVMKLIETIRGDTYLLYMSIAGAFILALSIILFLLDR